MNALGDRHVSLEFGNVHVRHTWACTVDGCQYADNEWEPLIGSLGAQAMLHARMTGHETIVITEARTVHQVKAEA